MKRLFRTMTAAAVLFGVGTGVMTSEAEAAKHMSTSHITNVAHRGASGYAPEHTMLSYELGDVMHGDYVEIDLQMTKDGKLIAMHDETVNRTTNGSGRVKDLTLADIKKLDAGSWFNKQYPERARSVYVGLRVPTLSEIFKKLGPTKKYYIETKSPDVYPGMEEELLRLMNKYHISKETTLIQSFSKESLLKVKRLDPDVKLVQLLSYKKTAVMTDEQLAELKTYAMGIGPNFTYLTKEYVQKVRTAGLAIHPYTVNEVADMTRLIEWGVTGMFTNYPNRLHSVLQAN
ncbi:GlpQ [Fictibacillus macauensis ZFHKF-1]|uniref:GlpQ n=1 Tax=Fictibacillus macauensis ZFHKF-1 TaxID=1196324 RepID=I8AKU7_9BACL|nr:glycerophosphodiester phosphodiesterase [Fictibacillus macauensis]EIT86214.1 GlpQ [Fictibacillus macauensis ZFHKF-1]